MIMREMENKVLITTSGLGSRLGKLSEYTNKSLIKLGDKAIISHIIDSYPFQDFVITLGYYGDLVKQYLEIAHPNRNFEFVWVDPYEGEGSGLLTSMSFAKEKLQCPFIFHACDTILGDNWRPPLLNNYMACVESSQPDLFRTVCISDGHVTKINEKGETNYDLAYIGVAGIYDYKLFWEKLEQMLSLGIKDSSDCHVLSSMIKTVNINVWQVNEWHDTGSVHTLNLARSRYPQLYDVLDKPEESIYFIDDHVIKFFADKLICSNRIKRAEVLMGLIPSFENSSNNFYKYKKEDGELLANVITENKIKYLIEYGEEYLWTIKKIDNLDFKNICSKFYYNKTIERVLKFQRSNGITDKPERINDIDAPSLETILNSIDWDWITSSKPTGFHGDFILDNIIYNDNNPKKFVLLDWRQDFGGLIDVGDKYYDLAKLNHNLILNHHLLLEKRYTIGSVDGHNIQCDVLRSQNMVNCQLAYWNILNSKNIDIDKVKIITALIWLNMSPLHTYPLNNFLYYFGKYYLWKELQKRT